MLHAYCIRSAEVDPPGADLTGVGGARVNALSANGLSIWISESAPPPITADRLREHEMVVRHALRSATPLPLRFGTTFPDETQARKFLSSRSEELQGQLSRLSAHVEMGLRVTLPAESPPTGRAADLEDGSVPDTRPGRAHLEARRRLLHEAARRRADLEDALQRVEAELSDLELDTVRSILAADPPVGTLAQLVRRDQLQRYRRRIEAVSSCLPDVEIVISGPWAPYSFVSCC